MIDLPLSKSGRRPLEIAAEVIKQAGEILLSHSHSIKEIKDKGKNGLVTEVDILSEKAIVDVLTNEYPEYNILSEESTPTTPVTGYTWIVDPLAGTNNYAYGIPLFCINMALAREKDVLLAITYDPVRGELFRAEKGRGAFLNDLPIHISKKTSLQTSLLCFDPGYDAIQGRKLLDFITRLWPGVHGLRAMGSASIALAYVACGRIDLYIRSYLHPWDIASGLLLVNEAGGKVSDWQGIPADLQTKEIIAANSTLQQDLLIRLN
jgi:myo-inositol-1(or 4)-monophosphatase